eukprot:SAG31_NODE_33895_length_339_cov_0.625000_1_plen_49_part_10
MEKILGDNPSQVALPQLIYDPFDIFRCGVAKNSALGYTAVRIGSAEVVV